MVQTARLQLGILEWNAGFGIYDPHTNTYKMELINALLKRFHALILTYFDFFLKRKLCIMVGIKQIQFFSPGYYF